jgi:hypothetical protein
MPIQDTKAEQAAVVSYDGVTIRASLATLQAIADEVKPQRDKERSEEAKASRLSRKDLSLPVLVLGADEFDALVARPPMIFAR